MQSLATQNDEFALIHTFFVELSELNGKKYLRHCRNRMPVVADALLRASEGVLIKSPIIQAMQRARSLTDEQLVGLSAMALDLVSKTIYNAMDVREPNERTTNEHTNHIHNGDCDTDCRIHDRGDQG